MRIPLIKIVSQLSIDNGLVHRVGSNVHDELMVDMSSGSIYYHNLQCGGTSKKYKHSRAEYRFDYIPDPIDGCEQIIEFVTLKELAIIGFKEWIEKKKNDRKLKKYLKATKAIKISKSQAMECEQLIEEIEVEL